MIIQDKWKLHSANVEWIKNSWLMFNNLLAFRNSGRIVSSKWQNGTRKLMHIKRTLALNITQMSVPSLFFDRSCLAVPTGTKKMRRKIFFHVKIHSRKFTWMLNNKRKTYENRVTITFIVFCFQIIQSSKEGWFGKKCCMLSK